MNTPIYESISRFNIGPWRIRVWREEKELGAGGNGDLRLLTDDLVTEMVSSGVIPDHEKLLTLYSGKERVSAVEVVDELGTGALVYPSWP